MEGMWVAMMPKKGWVAVTPEVRAKMAAMDQGERLALCEAVCEAMGAGATVSEYCGLHGWAPTLVRSWMAETEAMRDRYQAARLLQAQALADEAVSVARRSSNFSSASDRILIDTLRWAAAKANPAEYGERQTVEHKGGQTLEVRVVEESVAVRNREALATGGAVVARLAEGAVVPEEVSAVVEVVVPDPVPGVDADIGGGRDIRRWSAKTRRGVQNHVELKGEPPVEGTERLAKKRRVRAAKPKA